MKPVAYLRVLAIGLALTVVGGCMEEQAGGTKHLRPLSQATQRELADKGMRKDDPIVVRIYKEENNLEVWKPGRDGRYAFFKAYDICAWSGKLGPKIREGDKQAPEGFYTVTPGQMNPNSSYYLSFNIGFPNSYDKAHGRTGKHLMVHGACSSAGCYAMEDDQIAEIYALARESFRGGQRDFQVQAYPFRMTPANMAKHAGDANIAFWRKLKEGSDHFEVTGKPPEVGVCGRDYVFNAKPADPSRRLDPLANCPQLETPREVAIAVASKQMRDETAYQVALAEIKLQEQLRQPQPGQSDVIMTASIEEGSTSGYSSEAAASKVLGAPASEAATASAVAAAPAQPASGQAEAQVAAATPDPDAPPSPVQASVPSAATAFSGVWGRLVDMTGLRALSKVSAGEVPAGEPGEAAAVDGETTGSVTAPETELDDKSADAGGALPRLTPATAFVPLVINENPFAIFDFFAEVDGVSVPADIVRR